ncbi:hypothetical protein LSH36_458g02009 [Paralvinella palmiformis]|uniref:Copine-3 n=1 Tax=Paralvinella palmiformis TaxID=53620 RepID=A0AAD9MXN9_9ANNE|nr:hypothetical protein LSH36_458g02009 [Paralvinella palmiformis]
MALAQRMSRVPLSKVELFLSCTDLLNKDVSSKSDPCAVMYIQTGGVWKEVGRTENIKNTLNPNFAQSFELDYYFEEVQRVQVCVYDIDNKTSALSDDDFLGLIETTLGQIVSGSPLTRGLLLRNGKPAGKGQITIRSQEDTKVNDVLHMTFRAEKLDNKRGTPAAQLVEQCFVVLEDTFGKSDPFLEFSRQMSDGSWQVVHRTEVVKNDLSPKWKPFHIKAQKLTGGSYEAAIRVACYDSDDDGQHDLIGQCDTSVPQLLTYIDEGAKWPCINPKKQSKKKHYKDSGIIILDKLEIVKEYSFLDYIFGGLDIHFTVGIDFTASNGDPRTPQSLHYINPYQPNDYQKAIQAVGTVIQDYDSDQQFPALGFGAKVPPTMEVSHQFAINFDPSNPFCAGIGGVLQAYSACIPQVQLYGPTNFTPIIRHVVQFAEVAQRENTAKNYFILLIITDGVISDIRDTVSAIVHSSCLPMSIIIVGVGPADFKAMDILDADGGLLKSPDGQVARRDIVQFIPFRDFANVGPEELAKAVLAEVPRQVVDYYRLANLSPAQSQGPA